MVEEGCWLVPPIEHVVWWRCASTPCGAFSHSAGTAPIITLFIPGTPPANHPPSEACMIHSKTHRRCRVQGPGTRGYRGWKRAEFSHSARCAPEGTADARRCLPHSPNPAPPPSGPWRGGSNQTPTACFITDLQDIWLLWGSRDGTRWAQPCTPRMRWQMCGRGVAQGGWGGSFGEEQGSGIPLGPVQ